MTHLLCALLLFLSLAGSLDSPAPVYNVAYVSKVKYEMWFDACVYSPYSCERLNVPGVKQETLRGGLLGYYKGGDVVVVRRGLRGLRLKKTLMHEMIHYIQVHRGGLIVPGPAKQICRAEEEAFRITDLWATYNGYRWLIVGDDWWKPYTYCWRWYDPEWATYSDFDRAIWSLEP